jgi:uncharacterized protein (TIGR00106 family)
MEKEKRLIAELSIVPLSEGSSVSNYVKEALKELRATGLRVEPTAMGTILEADDMDSLLEAVKRAHEAVFRAGAMRAVTTLKIDDRRDKKLSIEGKLKSIK